jgi:hypothetical protein
MHPLFQRPAAGQSVIHRSVRQQLFFGASHAVDSGGQRNDGPKSGRRLLFASAVDRFITG